MSFILQNLGKVSASANTDAPAKYTYTHPTDNLATITAADYFIERVLSFQVKDILDIVASDKNGTVIITQLTPTLTVAEFAEGQTDFITSINTNNLIVTAGELDTIQPINVTSNVIFNQLEVSVLGVGTPTPAPDAIAEFFATDKAVLFTRLTTAQRDALAAVDGMIIYNTTTNAFNGRAGGAWVAL